MEGMIAGDLGASPGGQGQWALRRWDRTWEMDSMTAQGGFRVRPLKHSPLRLGRRCMEVAMITKLGQPFQMVFSIFKVCRGKLAFQTALCRYNSLFFSMRQRLISSYQLKTECTQNVLLKEVSKPVPIKAKAKIGTFVTSEKSPTYLKTRCTAVPCTDALAFSRMSHGCKTLNESIMHCFFFLSHYFCLWF